CPQEPGDRPGPLYEREAVLQRDPVPAGRPGTAQRAATGGIQRQHQAGGAFPAWLRQLQNGEGAGSVQLLPVVRSVEEPVSSHGGQEPPGHQSAVFWSEVNLLIPNLGSTSLKYQIIEMPSEKVLARGRLERVADYRDAIRQIDTAQAPVDAVALKAVHAGPKYRGTVVVDDVVEAARPHCRPAAPAHNAIYLTAIEAFREAMPRTSIVAAFEPEFHATMPEHARLYGVPGEWLEDGVAKYGFHGASHQYVSERVEAMLGRKVKLVSCHLGGSSSMCAIDGGRSVDTTMGFSPRSGLENSTRPGEL